MERVYALGIICIEHIQEWFIDSEDYLQLVNHISNPHHALQYIFPLVSIVDSVFASQFLLCMAFGEWLNAVMKWWLLEDRPYWWVRETTFYDQSRPRIYQYPQTCETGPGCPSGHTTTMAMQLVLFIMWISHIMNDRKYYIWWWKYIIYPLFAAWLGAVMLARMFVATHFPHQCLCGAIVGLFLAPALCIYVSDPYIWGSVPGGVTRAVKWHVVSALTTIAISVVTYWSLKLCGVDPQWSIKLAFRWCENAEWIHVSSTPMFALVQSTASLLGWALCVTPAVAKYRHYTTRRSLLIAIASSCLIVYLTREFQSLINRDKAWCFYMFQFIVYAIKPVLFLKFVPYLATMPYGGATDVKKNV